MTFLFYVYRIDCEVNGGTPASIAIGCVGANGKQPCDFDDLMKYVQRTGKRDASGKDPFAVTQSSGAGDFGEPDVTETANRLKLGGYNALWDNGKILGTAVLARIGTDFSALYDELADQVQTWRSTRPVTEAVDRLETGLKEAMLGIHSMRVADAAKFEFAELEAEFDYKPEKKVPPVTAIDGETTFDVVDVEKTEADHPGFTTKYRTFMQKVQDPEIRTNDKPFWKAHGGYIRHEKAVMTSQKLSSRFIDGCT
jgi:hypothetical protein